MAQPFNIHYLKANLPATFDTGLSAPLPSGVVVITITKDQLNTLPALQPVKEYTARALADCFFNGVTLQQQFNSEFYHYVLPAATQVIDALIRLGSPVTEPAGVINTGVIDTLFPFFTSNMVQGLFSSYLGDDGSICVLDVCSPRFTQNKIQRLVPRGLEFIASRFPTNSKLGVKFDNPLYQRLIPIYISIGYRVKKIDTLLGGKYNGFNFLLMERPGGRDQPISPQKQQAMTQAALLYKGYLGAAWNITLRLGADLIRYIKHLVNDLQNETGGILLGTPIQGVDRTYQLYLPCFLETKNLTPITPANVATEAFATVPFGLPVSFHTHPQFIGVTTMSASGYLPGSADNIFFLIKDFFKDNVNDTANAFTYSNLNFVFSPEGAYTYSVSAPFYETLYQLSIRPPGQVTIGGQRIDVNSPRLLSIDVAKLSILYIFLASAYVDSIRTPTNPTLASYVPFLNSLFGPPGTYSNLRSIEDISAINTEMVINFYKDPAKFAIIRAATSGLVPFALGILGDTTALIDRANATFEVFEQMYGVVTTIDPRFNSWDVFTHITIVTVSLYMWPADANAPLDVFYTNRSATNLLQNSLSLYKPVPPDPRYDALVTTASNNMPLGQFNSYLDSLGRDRVWARVTQCEGFPPYIAGGSYNPSVPPRPNSVELSVVM